MPGNENKVCKLIKSLYGLKQAPKQWHQKFVEVVLLNGYLLNQADKCVYSKFDETGKGVIICLYVDDMLRFGHTFTLYQILVIWSVTSRLELLPSADSTLGDIFARTVYVLAILAAALTMCAKRHRRVVALSPCDENRSRRSARVTEVVVSMIRLGMRPGEGCTWDDGGARDGSGVGCRRADSVYKGGIFRGDTICLTCVDSLRVSGVAHQIMATSAIVISSDSSDKSVGSPPSRVILFCDILTVIPSTSVVAPESSTIAPIISSAAPVVETTLVASPTGLCGLAISPFLCTDSFKAPDSSDGPPSQDPYVATVARWRSRVTARLSSSSEFPIAPVTASPGILGPLPTRRLACRHALPRSSNHRSSSSSSSLDSSPVHSSGLDASDQAHSGSSTRGVPPRLCYPPRRAPRRKRPLHSSSHSVGPSRKRCRSSVDFVPSSTPVMGSLAPTRADLLPPRKMFRDSYSSEASIEEDTEIDPIETEVDIELGIGVRDDVRDHVEIDPRDVRDDTKEYEDDTSVGDTVEVGIDLMSAPIVEEEIVEPAGEDSSDLSGTRDGIVRSFEDIPIDLYDVVRDFYHHMSEVRIDRIVEIETAQRRLEADQLIVRTREDRMSSLRLHMSLLQEEFCQVRRDRDDTRGRLRRLESYVERCLGFRP
ncbi:reverse transcriptase domain-containing protein [Tanacetum coccineum]|uniref:Reverse transcriptase domain-containing protein n=1 Tax=Tanacetum coccineum TaxID=301880 RepID=A0ABQ4Y2M9_9ASTR